MKTRRSIASVSVLILLLHLAGRSLHGQGTVFTYQGRLNNTGSPANGSYDVTFAVWDALGGGSMVAGPVTNALTSVSNGLFTVTLDFGVGAFNGASRWLEIGVRTNGGGGFATLIPRQPVTSTPYAIQAANFSGVIAGSQIVGTYGGVVNFSNPANRFAGDGGGLTNLNASNLSSGVVPDARLAANIVRSNQAWLLNGNGGTSPLTNFVGTTDNQALELRVNGSRALRVEPQLLAPNLIGGNAANFNGPGVSGAAIAGGGRAGSPNVVTSSFGAVGGGYGNAAGQESANGGGVSNFAGGVRVVVAGGALNTATNALGVVSGGAFNLAGGYAAVVAGGGGSDPVFGNALTNRALGNWSVVGGGRENSALGESATAGGGERNEARGKQATASGGVGNQSLGEFSTLGGGAFNTADFPASTVSGGQENGALNMHATVGGGVGNYALADKSTIGGGANNLSTGPHATVPGGQQANPTQYGQLAHAAGMFLNPGDAQHSMFVLRARTDVAIPKARLALDGGPTELKIEPNRSLTFDVLVVARAEPPLTDTAGYHFRGVVKDAGGLAAFVGAPTVTTLGSDVPLWSAALALVGDALVVEVDGGGGAGYPATVRWVARLDAAQVAW